jgi:outer membrane protein TolC
MHIWPKSRFLIGCLLASSLAGCALYHAKSLPKQPDLTTHIQPLRIDTKDIHLPGLKPHPFDPAKGLDMTDVAILAVVNNPALRTARAQARANEAQAFVAGLLPGPQINYSLDHPTNQGSQYVNAHSAGLAYDLSALLTYSSTKGAARATAKQVDLDLLWQEWQVAQQARLLYVDCLTNTRKLTLLSRLLTGMQQRYRAEQHASAAGNLALDSLGLDLAALQNVESLASSTATAKNVSCRSLNQVLGLQPEVVLNLAPGKEAIVILDSDALEHDLTELPNRRPDLLALKFGYQSQDQEVWRAVLAQFPGINFGITRAQDTSDVHTTGFSVGINFPFLSGGAAAVHAAEATRDALWQQYQQRLDEALSEVRLVQADIEVLNEQLDSIQRTALDAHQILIGAQAAYTRGDLTAPAYYDLSTAALNTQLAHLDIQAQRQQLQIALETLLGLPPQDLQHPVPPNEKQP